MNNKSTAGVCDPCNALLNNLMVSRFKEEPALSYEVNLEDQEEDSVEEKVSSHNNDNIDLYKDQSNYSPEDEKRVEPSKQIAKKSQNFYHQSELCCKYSKTYFHLYCQVWRRREHVMRRELTLSPRTSELSGWRRD